jgi:hypothetical protein
MWTVSECPSGPALPQQLLHDLDRAVGAPGGGELEGDEGVGVLELVDGLGHGDHRCPRHEPLAGPAHAGAVVVEALAESNARESAYGLPDTGDLEADLAAVVRAVVDELADPTYDALLRALSVETLLDPALREQVLTSIFRPQVETFAERFAAAAAVGQIADGVARRAVRALEVRNS